MNILSFFSKTMTGIDVQAGYLTCMQCQKLANKLSIIQLAKRNLPSGLFYESKIIAWDIFQRELKNFVEETQIKGKVVVCLPTQLVRMQTIQLPANLTDSEIEAEINLHLQRDLPGLTDNLWMDFVPISHEQSGHMDVCFAVTRQEYIARYIDCFSACDLNVNAVDVEILALKRACYFGMPTKISKKEISGLIYLSQQKGIFLILDAWHIHHNQYWHHLSQSLAEFIQTCLHTVRYRKISKLVICGMHDDLYSFEQMDECIECHAINLVDKLYLTDNDIKNKLSSDLDSYLIALGLMLREMNQ